MFKLITPPFDHEGGRVVWIHTTVLLGLTLEPYVKHQMKLLKIDQSCLTRLLGKQDLLKTWCK